MDEIIAKLARDLGFTAGAVRLWRYRGGVPWKHRDKIRELARQQSLGEIPTSAFDQFGKADAA